MPEIKIKHVVSFSSEDKVHKSENILKAETYRKWKCATPGESKASVVLQFEKATQIHSIDIGNECSAFVEILVGRSSDTVNDYQVLLVASSFMSPLESRNETHTNRVRMFGPEKLSQNLKDQKWDCVQIVCTQPFNKNITYGLSFIKFHSPPEKLEEQPSKTEVAKKAPVKLGAFTIKYEDDEDEDDDSPSLFSRSSQDKTEPLKSPKPMSPSPSSTIKVTNSPSTLRSPGNPPQKRKVESNDSLDLPPAKKDPSITHVNRKKFSYVDVLGRNSTEAPSSTDEDKRAKDTPSMKNSLGTKDSSKNANNGPKIVSSPKAPAVNVSRNQNSSKGSPSTATGSPIANKIGKVKNRLFDQIMKKVVFVISGFVNPLRSTIREKALDMGAKYKADWDRECTHLICAFENTPKYFQVQKAKGKIVTKDWVMDCHRTKSLLHWRKYMLGKYTWSSSSESETEDPPPRQKKTTDVSSVNGSSKISKENKPGTSKIVVSNTSAASTSKSDQKDQDGASSGSQSETEDEDAIRDYKADTDVENDSGGDTEDEIRKVENAAKGTAKKDDDDSMQSDEDDSTSLLGPSKPDTSDLPLPDLPNFFKKRHFFLYGSFSSEKLFDLERYITAYDGVIDTYMGESTKYVVTDCKWDKHFDDALTEHEDLVFVKSKWIYKCHEEQKFIPHQAFVVIPSS